MSTAPTGPILESDRAVRRAALCCAGAAVIACIGGVVLGHAVIGIALGVGLAIGAGNGELARVLLATGLPFFATSLARLVGLTLLALILGLVFGLHNIWALVLGIGVAQLVLAAVSAREVWRAPAR